MTLRVRVLLIPALAFALAGCGSLFGSEPRERRAQPEEWHPPRTILQAYDSNHDGTLTRAEMDAGLKGDFAKADANHDGHLDETEVRAVNAQRWTTDSSTASPLVDWNSDGFVDFKEFAANAHSLFDQMDIDGDGKLSPEELKPRQPPTQHRQRGRGERGGPGGDPDGD